MNHGEVKKGNKQGEEDHQGEEHINNSLPSWRNKPIEDIYPYMSLETEGISGPHHEKKSVEVIGHVVGPQRSFVEYIPHYGGVDHAEYEADDDPSKTLG